MSEKRASPGQIVTVAVVIGLVYLFARTPGKGNGPAEPVGNGSRMSQSYALMLCQTAVKQTLVDPDSASVPYVENSGRGDEFYFAWGASTSHIRSKNRMGLEVASSASCTVDAKSGGVTALTVNGKTIR